MSQHSTLVGGVHRTPQSQPLPGEKQVENSAGGFVYQISPWDRLRRFLILGTEGGTYYTGAQELTRQNIQCLADCVAQNGLKVVDEIVEISDGGNAKSNDPALYALAYCAKKGDRHTRKAAYDALPQVARIGTHLFHWAEYVKALGGFGSGTQRAIANWYNRDVDKIAYQAVKYPQRDGWSHRDMLRKAHAKPESPDHDGLFDWIVKGMPYAKSHMDRFGDLPEIVEGYQAAQRAETPKESARLISQYNLPREVIHTEHLNSVEVWEALAENMPMTALIRNLGKMSSLGMLTATSDTTRKVVDQLTNAEAIQKARIHPISVLAAAITYKQGHGFRGSLTWNVIPQIMDALDSAFYLAFGNVEPTGKRIRLALDVSGSMFGNPVNGIPGLDAATGAAAMALVTAKVEQFYDCVAFADESTARAYWRERSLTQMALSGRQRLDDVLEEVRRLSRYMGGTDCALPITHAMDEDLPFDAFIVYTDNETWAGNVHPSEALREYRKRFVTEAKLIVVGMTATDFSIADPNDPGMLDVVGFDTSAPNLMSEFIRGSV